MVTEYSSNNVLRLDAERSYAAGSAAWQELIYARLDASARLKGDEYSPLDKLTHDKKTLRNNESLREPPGTLALVTSGWCYRFRLLEDGRSVVYNLWLPGDLFSLSPPAAGTMPGTAAAGPAELLLFDEAQFKATCAADTALATCWTESERLETKLLANQVLRGRLTAYERVAHFLLEVHDRLSLVDLAGNSRFHLPLTQEILGDTVGLSSVHISRTLSQLRNDDLIELERHEVYLKDIEQMVEFVEYDPISANSIYAR